ncbi:unnamed protein product [Notodromas monacha]|uniref:Uncharacterized protein n=1 Tax=Notodromas monacha TaxID=399045 RepID=A0A7R9GF16_9CRUS|nr:unnamed protein product [Notodromas monacha]CAG0920216.1 unnamed protein product [Notodromas monacha]
MSGKQSILSFGIPRIHPYQLPYKKYPYSPRVDEPDDPFSTRESPTLNQNNVTLYRISDKLMDPDNKLLEKTKDRTNKRKD